MAFFSSVYRFFVTLGGQNPAPIPSQTPPGSPIPETAAVNELRRGTKRKASDEDGGLDRAPKRKRTVTPEVRAAALEVMEVYEHRVEEEMRDWKTAFEEQHDWKLHVYDRQHEQILQGRVKQWEQLDAEHEQRVQQHKKDVKQHEYDLRREKALLRGARRRIRAEMEDEVRAEYAQLQVHMRRNARCRWDVEINRLKAVVDFVAGLPDVQRVLAQEVLDQMVRMYRGAIEEELRLQAEAEKELREYLVQKAREEGYQAGKAAGSH